MTDPTKTHIAAVLDRSGSMGSILDDTKGGFDSFVAEQKKAPGTCTLSLTQFDHVVETVYAGRDIHEVPPLTLVPRGSTALLDAITKTIKETGAYLRSLPEDQRPGNVIFVILTDGDENDSKDATNESVKALIEEQSSKYSWKFLFLGASPDTFSQASKIGIRRDWTLNYVASETGAESVFASTAANVSTLRSYAASGLNEDALAAALDYSAGQREEASV